MKRTLTLLLGAMALSHAQSSPPDNPAPPATPAMVLEEIRELKAQQQRLEEQLQQNQQNSNSTGLPANVQLQVVEPAKADSGVVIEWLGKDSSPEDSSTGLLGIGAKFPGVNSEKKASKADGIFSSSTPTLSQSEQGLLVGWGLLLDPNSDVGMGALSLGYYTNGENGWTALYLTYGDFLFEEGGDGGSVVKVTGEIGGKGTAFGLGVLAELGLTQTSDGETDRNGVLGAGVWMQIWKFQAKCIMDIPDYIPDAAPLVEIGMRFDI